MNARFFLVSVVAAGLASLAQGQEGKPSGEHPKRLQYFVGAWDVAVQFKLPDGSDNEGKALCQTKWILDEKFVHQEYKSKFMGQPLTVWQFLGYDDAKKKFVEFQLHVSVGQTHTMQNEGSFSDNGKVLTLTGDSINSHTGKPVKLRAVTTIVDDDHYTVELFIAELGSKEERQVVLTHTRKK